MTELAFRSLTGFGVSSLWSRRESLRTTAFPGDRFVESVGLPPLPRRVDA